MQESDDRTDHHRHDHHHHDGGDDHDGGHDHPGGHVHAPASFGKAFAIGITLNTALVVAEAVYGYLGNSTALMADAGHNLSDVFGLLVAWAASIASKRAPSGRFTYGLRGSSILAALANAVFLLVATGAIGGNPSSVSGTQSRSPASPSWSWPQSASSSTEQPRCCSRAAARETSTSEARSCTWPATPRCRPASWPRPRADPLDRVAVAGSGDEPGDLRRHPVEHVESAAKFDRYVDERGARRKRRRGAVGTSCLSRPGVSRDARPARLADQHDGDRDDVSSGDARRTPRRRLPHGMLPDAKEVLQDTATRRCSRRCSDGNACALAPDNVV